MRRLCSVVGALALAVSLLAPAAHADFSDQDFSAFSTGTVVHADAIEDAASQTRVADVEVAFSGAATDSGGLEPVHNEFDRPVVPDGLSDQSSYGRGSGLEIGLGVTPEDENQVIVAGKAEASAPPSEGPVVEEVGPLPADPLAYASLLRGEAEARWNPECVVGADIARGLGFAEDAQLLDQDGEPDAEGEDPTLEQPVLATDTRNPDRAVSQSTSNVRLVPQLDADGNPTGRFGVMSETRMTIAPVTLARGPEGEGSALTVEFLGEWVLRAVATGTSGEVHYGPGDVEPDTPVLRVVDEATGDAETVVRAQDLLGEEGLVVDIPEAGIEIALGEDARAIGGDAESEPTETATSASGAVDVVRVRLLDVPEQGGTVSDLRIGHMEAGVEVPAEGIGCELDVAKDVDPETVTPGEEFTYTITVGNPFEGCTLEQVQVVDRISATEGVTFEVVGQQPPADSVTGEAVTWSDVGPIPPGESETLTLRLRVGDDSAEGVITDEPTATGICAVASADGSTDVEVPVQGQAELALPEVGAEVAAEVAGEQVAAEEALPRTGGGTLGAALGLGLLGAAAALRRRLG